jgi:SAM-dependent methyltransferase
VLRWWALVLCLPKYYPPAEPIPLCWSPWAAKSEDYASLIAEHLSPETNWLDAGCGSRLLEPDLEALEDWLTRNCGAITGLDLSIMENRNIQNVAQGSLYRLPFGDGAFDLVTCNMVIEHLDHPGVAFSEVARCLRSDGVFIVNTPNLINYGVFANLIATKFLPESIRLRIVGNSDGRGSEDIFPVRYKANTAHRLTLLLKQSGFSIHRIIRQKQPSPFFHSTQRIEKLFMRITPNCGLLVCAHKDGPRSDQ